MTHEVAPDLLSVLRCPVEGTTLEQDGPWLYTKSGRRYPVVMGVPVLLRTDIKDTLWVFEASREAAMAWASGDRHDEYFVDTLGLTRSERSDLKAALVTAAPSRTVDPVVSSMLPATCGHLYLSMHRSASKLPIPEFRMDEPPGRLLDIGCNWGRWLVSAARAGHTAVGLDPSLGGVIAAKRVCKAMGAEVRLVVGDARHLPFASEAFDYVHSYSVLQHFSRDDAEETFVEIARTIRKGGVSYVQMANRVGVRSCYSQLKRGLRDAVDFQVRYWSLKDLRRLGERVGPTRIEVDGFFGLGIQPSDKPLLDLTGQLIVSASEVLRSATAGVPGLVNVADSVYVRSERASE